MSTQENNTRKNATELFSRVNHIEQNQSSMQTEITGIKNTLERLVEIVTGQNKPNWSAIIGFLSLAVMVLTPILFGISKDNERLELIVNNQSNEFKSYVKETTDRLIERAKFMGASTKADEIAFQQISDNTQKIYQMQQDRFRDSDGEKLSEEIEKKLDYLQEQITYLRNQK